MRTRRIIAGIGLALGVAVAVPVVPGLPGLVTASAATTVTPATWFHG
jgi:hypothetical protein